VGWAYRLDSPEVERVTLLKVYRVTSPTSKPRATDESIDEATHVPRPGGSGIAVLATDGLDPRPNHLNRVGGVHNPKVLI
jgi:hypothetical protein